MSQRLAKDAAAIRPDQVGFFGKAPTHGDFVASGVDASLQEALDHWIQTGMQASEQALGRDWRDRFQATAPWRFIVEAGIWGPSTVAGVLIPSTDRVGRSFPFVILAQLGQYADDPRWLYFDKTWFTAAEALAETSRARDFDLSVLPAGLKRLRLPRARTQHGEEVEHVHREPSMNLVSIWWMIDPETGKPRGFQTTGAPGATDFGKLLANPPTETKQSQSNPPAEPRQPQGSPQAESKHAGSKTWIFERSHATHPGTRLTLNSDALLVSDAPRLLAIADGVGDATSSADAAKVTVNALAGTPDCQTLAELVQEVKGKFGRAQSMLQSYRGDGPIASAAAIAIVENSFAVVWAGDVRAYLMRDGMMRPLTRDHIEIGLNRRLSRAIGAPGQLTPDTVADHLHPTDRLLLCSAPLLRALDDRTIAEILLETPVTEVAAALIQESLIANIRDNVSVIAVGVAVQ